MSLLVNRSSPSLVGPCEPTPSGTLLLSSIDRIPFLRSAVRMLHVFEHGKEPAKAIREAVSRALVLYYPLAGRVVESDQGELQVACTGEGALFVEASANFSLDDVNFMDHPFVISPDNFLPDTPPGSDPANPHLRIQVTEFTCGGFVIGLQMLHAIVDAFGSAQFLNTIAEFTRGLDRPTIEPVWSRETIPDPPKPKPKPNPPPKEQNQQQLPTFRLEYTMLELPLHHINQLKTRFLEQTGKKCSMFDVLTAKLWRSRTRAIDPDPDVEMELNFAASARHLLHMERGYYGNCWYPIRVKAPSAKIMQASIVEVVKLIKEAKEKLSIEFAKWEKGEMSHDPFEQVVTYNTLIVSDWTHAGFNKADFGWGTQIRMVPVLPDFMLMCAPGLVPVREDHARLILQCVEKVHLAAFYDQMMDLACLN